MLPARRKHWVNICGKFMRRWPGQTAAGAVQCKQGRCGGGKGLRTRTCQRTHIHIMQTCDFRMRCKHLRTLHPLCIHKVAPIVVNNSSQSVDVLVSFPTACSWACMARTPWKPFLPTPFCQRMSLGLKQHNVK